MLKKEELTTIATLSESLTHYQILKVSALASNEDIQEAFHREALVFHPDQYFSANDKDSLELSKKIYARIVDAYRTLTDRKKREDYDRNLNAPKTTLSEEDENAITSVRKRPEGLISGAGARFFKLAQTAVASKDFQSAKMNIQLALNADAKNPQYLQLQERIQSELRRISDKK